MKPKKIYKEWEPTVDISWLSDIQPDKLLQKWKREIWYSNEDGLHMYSFGEEEYEWRKVEVRTRRDFKNMGVENF